MTRLVKRLLVLAFLGLGMFAIAPAFADKPEWAGDKQEKKMQKEEKKMQKQEKKMLKHEKHGYEPGKPYFTDQHRTAIVGYYGASYRSGKCPPGLAKKHNGCMPPGQAKKYELNQPLPRGVVYYGVPSSVVRRMGPPPPGYRYVRVDSDILLMAIGTRMVVDAITNLTH